MDEVEITSCQCDRKAWALSRPFCGYCGRRLSAPVLCAGDGPPLKPDAPVAWPVAERGALFGELTLSVQQMPLPGWLDSALLVNEFGIPQIRRARLVHGARDVEVQTQVSAYALTVRLPPAIEEDSFQHSATLSLYFELSGMASGREFCYGLALQTGAQLELESDDPRVEREGVAPRLVYFSNRPNLPPIVLRLRGPQNLLGAAESVRLERSGTASDARVAVQRENDLLALFINGETLAGLLGEDDKAPLRLIVSGARGSVGMELECVRRRRPAIAFRSTVLAPFDFKTDDDENWCTDGLSRPLIVGEIQHWMQNYELAIEANDNPELLKAADFSIEPANASEEELRGAELKLVVRIRPEWLYANNLSATNWRRDGKISVVLRNLLNESRGAKSPVELGALSVTLIGAARSDLFALAIDFGTSNTSSAVLTNEIWKSGEPIMLAEGAVTPTLLYYLQPLRKQVSEGQILVGREALSQNIRRHDDVLFRRGLKTSLLERALDETNGDAQKFKLSEAVEFSIDEMAEHFLSAYFKKLVTSRLVDGRGVQTLLYTYPVTSPENYRASLQGAMERAAARAGFKFYRSMMQACDEASAGGLWWFCKHRSELASRDSVTLLVYDYGGGTTDISVMEFKNLGEGQRWKVTILGVAGVTRAGGDDLTWRMAREFARCAAAARTQQAQLPRALSGDSPLGKKLSELKDTRGRRSWWDDFPGLIKMMEQYKPETVGAKVLTNVPDAVVADLLEGNASVLLGAEFDLHGKMIRPHPGRSATGQYALHVYNDWQADTRLLLAQREASGAMLLEHNSWVFDVGPREDGLLHEAEQAIEIARNMVRSLFGEAKKVDQLLLIGQASHAVYFRERLKSALSDSYALFAAADEDAKVCVAAGACDFHKFDLSDAIELVKTILKRIVMFYEEGMSGKMKLVELMKSSAERNRVLLLDAAPAALVRAKPHRFTYYVDATYSSQPNFAADLKLKRQMAALRNGFASSEKEIEMLVADPSDTLRFEDSLRVPEVVRGLIRKCMEEKPLAAHGWF